MASIVISVRLLPDHRANRGQCEPAHAPGALTLCPFSRSCTSFCNWTVRCSTLSGQPDWPPPGQHSSAATGIRIRCSVKTRAHRRHGCLPVSSTTTRNLPPPCRSFDFPATGIDAGQLNRLPSVVSRALCVRATRSGSRNNRLPPGGRRRCRPDCSSSVCWSPLRFRAPSSARVAHLSARNNFPRKGRTAKARR